MSFKPVHALDYCRSGTVSDNKLCWAFGTRLGICSVSSSNCSALFKTCVSDSLCLARIAGVVLVNLNVHYIIHIIGSA